MASFETPTVGGEPAQLPTLRLAAVDLIVADLDRSVAWYERSLGLAVHRRDAASAELGDGTGTVIVVHEDRHARPAGRHAGLFHYALLFGEREELARAAVRLSATETSITGASDHRTHEAIYLSDPDGNGIELAADRPRELWPVDLGYAAGPDPLDLDDLLGTVKGEPPRPRVGPGLAVGHLHLHVGDVETAVAFYRDVLGLKLNANLGTAAFLAAGDYHHHLGVNVWRGTGVGPAPDHTVGLRRWTIQLPDAADVEGVRARADVIGAEVEPLPNGIVLRDPWRIALGVVTA